MSNAIVVRLGLVLSLAASLPSCGPKGGTTTPEGGGGGRSKDGKDGIALRYAAAPMKLKQVGQFESNTRARGDYSEIAATCTVGLEVAPSGDKLKVKWTVADVGALEMKGSLVPKPGDEDPKAVLLRVGKGAYLVDLRGTLDEDGTTALPENDARKQELDVLKKQAEEAAKAGKQFQSPNLAIIQTTRAMVALPELPEAGLPVGKAVTTTVEEEVEVFDGAPKMATDTETTYTLVKIDDSGSKRIAEVQFESVTSGATELGPQTLVLESTLEGTMLFDIDGHAPVSVDLTTTQSFTSGSEQMLEITTTLKATFEPA